LSENKTVNKLLLAAACLLIAVFSICGQTPPPSFPSGAEAFSAPPLSTPLPKKVDVYDKHYTSEELTGILKFYDSPLGKKMSGAALPILKDSIDVAQELSKRATQSVMSDIRAEQLLQRPRAVGSLDALPTINPGNSAVSPTPMPSATAP
jgi:hypothetical protein